eukprot:scaffold364524_cov17-Prasinocladus_malaysianus.AAC.1
MTTCLIDVVHSVRGDDCMCGCLSEGVWAPRIKGLSSCTADYMASKILEARIALYGPHGSHVVPCSFLKCMELRPLCLKTMRLCLLRNYTCCMLHHFH